MIKINLLPIIFKTNLSFNGGTNEFNNSPLCNNAKFRIFI